MGRPRLHRELEIELDQDGHIRLQLSPLSRALGYIEISLNDVGRMVGMYINELAETDSPLSISMEEAEALIVEVEKEVLARVTSTLHTTDDKD